jgi:hypothetical protein
MATDATKIVGLAVIAAGVAGLGAVLLLRGGSGGARPARSYSRLTPPQPASQPSTGPVTPTADPLPKPAVVPLSQAEIVDAIEASISRGDVTPLARVARLLEGQSGPIQAYVTAASRRAKAYHVDIVEYVRTFGVKEREIAAQTESNRSAGIKAASTAAAAVNVIPVVGQAVSAILAIGIAVLDAVMKANVLPVRKAEDQIHPGFETLDFFRGIGSGPAEGLRQDRFLAVKQAVVQDPVAFQLPWVASGTQFPWAPTYEDFSEAAHELQLYPGEAHALAGTS